MAAEKKFENEIKRFLDMQPKTWYFKYWAGPYSKAGVPDIIACVNGHFVAIEVKAANGHASALQKKNIGLIKGAFGQAYILYPKDFEEFKTDIRKLINID
ncbi:VRR-NUC domain-containing protein [Clostridium botulinum]|nr:VRR-NUC domain-containing protein [Clostridium botulinum]NFO48402.1 VRR-NUC domain-containing protein [Clostridium botulinum]NFO58627.1 VRR-NUC domain-containing protein [Clostridium botulinum]